MNLLEQLKKNPFVLAPMAGITNSPFRSFMRDLGAGVVVTELVSATGLKYNSTKTKQLMEFEAKQHPIGIQIFGESLEDLAFASKYIEEMGADFVDLNFGCPVPKVVKKGAGAAILRDLCQVRDIFRTVVGATRLPVTVKIRTGWDETSRNAKDVCQIAFDEGITWVAIHGRTRAQAYSGRADWDFIADVKAHSKIPVLGNGDILTAEQACTRLKESGCDGVLIGRGCLRNPWIFAEANNYFHNGETIETKRDFTGLFLQFRKCFDDFGHEAVYLLQLKKFAAWFSAGYPGSSEFRGSIFKIREKAELEAWVSDYFAKYSNQKPRSFEGESFLMGGHG